MDNARLADLLFGDVTQTEEDIAKRYPQRELPEGAKVTRFGPSPTGFVHFGGLFPVFVSERLAHQSGGVFYLRIEDTDAKREVEGAAEGLVRTLEHYGVRFDEGAILGEDGKLADKGDYGPYRQSRRADIYHVFAKKLVAEGKAYPVFTTKEELERIKSADKKSENSEKDWDGAAQERREQQQKQRSITLEEVEKHLAAGDPYSVNILADGDGERKVKVTDLIKGTLELPENDEDFVLLKSDGIPTYHFAHAVDDHLMGTTHVVRGEEWLPSLPKHLQLFRYLGFKPVKYMHIAQLMRLDENGSKKKLSKRDMGANLDDYERMGYAPECVAEYVMTLLNSNFEEWHAQNADRSYLDFPFSIKKMSSSGCLFDFNKLNDVSKNVLSLFSVDKIYSETAQWAKKFDPEFFALLDRDPDYAKEILSIGRGGKKPRKDFAVYADVRPYMDFFYDELFTPDYTYPENLKKEDIEKVLDIYPSVYDESKEQNEWFDDLKTIAEKLGFAPEMKLYKQEPEKYGGHIGDVAMILRVAVTGRQQSPDTYCVMKILGKERVVGRIEKAKNALSERSI